MGADAQPMVDVAEKHDAGSDLSLGVFAGGAGILALLLLVSMASFVRNGLRAFMADASFDPAAQLHPGEAVIYGIVELSADAPHAVRVEIDQQGEEDLNSGAWSHKWKEVDRRVKVAPFYVRHSSGTRVRVEPGPEVMLIDELDATAQTKLESRTQIAELTPGERVMVHGRLVWAIDRAERQDGYRNAPANVLVMRPLTSKPMMMSTEELGARFRRHARAALYSMLVTFVAALLFAGLTSTYQASAYTGNVVPVTAHQRSYYAVEDDEGGWDREYWVSFARPGETVMQKRQLDDDEFVRVRKGMTLAYRDVAWGSGKLGMRPRMYWGVVVFGSIVVVSAVITWFAIRRGYRKWYEQARVVERGEGRLRMPGQR